ncbi:Elastase-2A, partial [Camponotus floridanus]
SMCLYIEKLLIALLISERPHLSLLQGRVYRDFSVRIIGDNEQPQTYYPFIVFFQNITAGRTTHFCAGSILSNEWIITRTHCLENIYTTDIIVKAGKHKSRNAENIGQTVKVGQIIIHENY